MELPAMRAQAVQVVKAHPALLTEKKIGGGVGRAGAIKLENSFAPSTTVL